jgi:hypothetical protein
MAKSNPNVQTLTWQHWLIAFLSSMNEKVFHLFTIQKHIQKQTRNT